MSITTIMAVLALAITTQTPLQRGIDLFDAGKFVDAERFFGDVVKQDPRNHTALYYLSRSIGESDIARMQRLDETRKWVEQAVALQPGNSNYHLWHGRTLGAIALNSSKLKMLGLAGKVKQAFETAVKLDPANVDARLALAEFYLSAPGIAGGDKNKGRQEVEAARKLSPYRGAIASARAHSSTSNWAAAEKELRALGRQYPDSVDVGVNLVLLFQTAKQYDRGFATLDSLQRMQPKEPIWLYQVGRTASVSGQQLERGEEALKAYLKVPEDRNRSAHAVANYRLGLIYEKQGKKALAKQAFQATLADQPRHGEAKKGLARVGK